jgi:hypothetical protein
MRHPKIVVTIKENLIQWKSQIKLPILALPKLYKEFTTQKLQETILKHTIE